MSNARARIHKAAKSQYAAIPNAIAQSRTLSPNARAILVELLSRPDDWEARADQLSYEHMSVRTVYRVLNELIDAGYVIRTAIKGEDGKMKHWRYDVFDAPVEGRDKINKVVSGTVEATSKRKSEAMRARTHYVDDGTHTKQEKEERETNAAPDEIPDHVPPHLRKVIAYPDLAPVASPDGGATKHQIVEAYCDAWSINVQARRDAVHRMQGRYAEELAAFGATPEDVFEMCKAKRAAGKQPGEYGLRLVQIDWPGWKTHAEMNVKRGPVLETPEQKAAREAAEEEARVEWRREQGII